MESATHTPTARRCDVLVVGAGLSGLVAAWRLRQAGLDVQVLEAAAAPGGVIGSVRREGCLYERGPNSAVVAPQISAIVQALGLQGQMQLASKAAGKRYVLHGGVPVPLPGSLGGFIGTPLFSAAAKFGLLGEPFRAPAAPGLEESIAAFVRRRLGREFLDYAVDPFVAGIYAGDPERISVVAAFPKLHALEQRGGSLVRGAILAARERRARGAPRKPPMQSFAFAGGLQALTDALAAGIGAVALSTRATALELTAPGLYTVRAEHAGQALAWSARAVVLAVPADAAATLLRPLAPDAAAALDSIEYAPVATVASAYRAADIAHALDGFGCLMPALERRRALGVLFSSSMFEGRAPQGTALLTTFIGGRRNPDLPALDEGAIAAVAQGEHAALLGARAAPLWQAVTRWPRAIPQYDIGHLQRVARAAAAETSLPGVHLCANWRGGVSVGDCVDNGHALGERLAAQLRAPA